MFDVERVGDHLGGEIRGVDLTTDLDATTVAGLHEALVRYQVIFFRDQDVSPARHRALALHFGPPLPHPAYPTVDGFPDISILESTRENPSKIELWHTDMTFKPQPPLGSILRARVLPPSGGDTLWMSLGTAFEALPDGLRERLLGMRAEHSFEQGFKESLAEPGGRERLAQALLDNPPVDHPVVRTHPVSGRRGLFVNRLFTTRILGLEPAESDDLLATLYEHMERAEFQCRFQWSVNAMAFWDNRQTQHVPVNDYWPHTRRMERITIEGDRPV
jgi:taurine dioxygenase